MKVTGYRSLLTTHRWGRPIGDANGVFTSDVTPVPVLLIDTDEGVTGVGLGPHDGVEHVFPAVIDQDPRAVTGLYDRMLDEVFKRGHQGSMFSAIGVVDTALWDLKAKLSDLPLWRLLGARERRVNAYASGLDIALSLEELDSLYNRFANHGLRSAKIKGGLDPSVDSVRLDIVAAALECNARRPGLALDANECWSVKQAVRHISLLEEHCDLAWVEEPVRRWDVDGLARVSSSVRAAVATGENLTGLEQYRSLVATSAADIVQTGSIYGITHFLRVGTLAHAFSLPVSPVGYHGNPLAHAAAAIPSHLAIELQDLNHPVGISADQEVEDGYIVLGNSPGLGLEIDLSALESPPIKELTSSDVPDLGPHRRPVDAGLRLTC